MNTQITYSFLTKSDETFFPGLKALLQSIRKIYLDKEIIVLDCGLNNSQIKFCQDLECKVINIDVSKYILQDENYSKAIFAFLELGHLNLHSDILIFLDADVIVMSDLDELVKKAFQFNVAAILDFPPIDSHFQILEEKAFKFIDQVLPGIDYNKKTFNAGVFAIKKKYFFQKILPNVKKILPIHSLLYGKDQILLNLAVQYSNKEKPFYVMGHEFNSRPSYTRAPEVKPLKLVEKDDSIELIGIAGNIKILHFVRYPKPWQKDYNFGCASFRAWKYFYELNIDYEKNKL